MLRKFTKLISVVFIFSMFFPCFLCGQNYYTTSSDFPQAQFKSTSAMPTSYSVPRLNGYGRAEYPTPEYGPSPIRRTSPPACECGDDCPGSCCNGGVPTGGVWVCECTPVGDIDILMILLMFSLWFIYKKHSQNKQNSEIQIQNTLNLKDNKL